MEGYISLKEAIDLGFGEAGITLEVVLRKLMFVRSFWSIMVTLNF